MMWNLRKIALIAVSCYFRLKMPLRCQVGEEALESSNFQTHLYVIYEHLKLMHLENVAIYQRIWI